MYRLINGNNIFRLTDGATIPAATGNADYQAYLEWTASGNVAPPEAPQLPTPIQQIRAKEQTQVVRDAMERANRLASFVVARTELVRQQAAKVPSVVTTHDQAHTYLYNYDKPYKLLWDLEQEVAQLRRQIA